MDEAATGERVWRGGLTENGRVIFQPRRAVGGNKSAVIPVRGSPHNELETKRFLKSIRFHQENL